MNVQIEELVLSATGLPSEQARDIAERVARRLGEALAEHGCAPAQIARLELRVKLRSGMGTDQIVRAISDAVLQQLG